VTETEFAPLEQVKQYLDFYLKLCLHVVFETEVWEETINLEIGKDHKGEEDPDCDHSSESSHEGEGV
jgi:hypothetical protein